MLRRGEVKNHGRNVVQVGGGGPTGGHPLSLEGGGGGTQGRRRALYCTISEGREKQRRVNKKHATKS